MLRKGFLKRKYTLSIVPRSILFTILIAIGYSTTYYIFLVFSREAIRHLSFMADHDSMLILTANENFFYSLFFSVLATLTGFSLAMDGLLKTQFQLPGFIKYSISNDLSGLQWYTNFWVTKLGLLYGVFCSTVPVYKYFDFYHDYWFLFPSILLISFFNQWMKFRLFLRADSAKWMGYSSVGILSFSVILACIPIINYKKLNHATLKNTISYNYKIEPPRSSIGRSTWRRSLAADIYLGFSKKSFADSVLLVTDASIGPMTIVNFEEWLFAQKQSLPENEQNNLSINFNVDANVKMKSLKEIFGVLRTNNIRKVKFVTKKYGWGIPMLLPPLLKESSDTTAGSFIYYSEAEKKFKEKSTLHIKLNGNSIEFDGQNLPWSQIESKLNDHLKKYQSDYLICVKVDNESSYQNYISLLDILVGSFVELRNKSAIKHFSRPYIFSDSEGDPELEEYVQRLYPMNLFMFSDLDWKNLGAN